MNKLIFSHPVGPPGNSHTLGTSALGTPRYSGHLRNLKLLTRILPSKTSSYICLGPFLMLLNCTWLAWFMRQFRTLVMQRGINVPPAAPAARGEEDACLPHSGPATASESSSFLAMHWGRTQHAVHASYAPLPPSLPGSHACVGL